MRAERLGLLREPSLAVALVIALVVALGFGLVIPVLPLFARDFGVGLFAVTLVVSVFAGVRLLSNPYTGPLTDRIGTARAVGWGALIVAASSLATAGAPSYWALVAFRGVGGFGSALFFNALLALVIRAVPADRRGVSVGMLQGAFLFGIMFGPTVGGLLAQPLGLRWPFVIYAAFCGSAGLVALRFLPRHDMPGVHAEAGGVPAPPTHAPRGLRATWETARGLSANRAFAAALLMMAASRWAATGVRFSLVPVFGAEQVGAGEAVIGLGLGLASVTHLLVVWPAGRIADTAGRRALGAPSFFAFAAVSASMGLAGTVPAFLTVLGLYGLATGLTSVTPPAIVGDVVPDERTGTGVGVLNLAGDLGSVLGPLVSGFLAQAAGYAWGFGASAVLLAVGGIAALRMRETLPRAAGAHP